MMPHQNYNKFESRASSILNRVSSRGNSEGSEGSYRIPKLHSRPPLAVRKRRKVKRSKPDIHKDDRSAIGS